MYPFALSTMLRGGGGPGGGGGGGVVGGGGGGGVHPDFFVKLGFDIAVDQQTRTSDRTFEGVPDPNRQTVPAGQPRPYLVKIRPNLAKYPEHAQNPDFRCSTCS